MKNISTVVLLILSNIALSQNYLTINPEWTEYAVICGGGNPYCTSVVYTIKLDGDTTFNNISYYKTKQEGISTTWDFTVDTLVSEIPIDNYHYPLREEDGRFYIYRISQNQEQLLHDFNLSVGDTAISTSSCPNPQIVIKIDTLHFGTQMRKRFIFSPVITWASSPLLEGIGTTRGLFVKPCSGVIGIESGSSLKCYQSNNEILQIDTSGQCETTLPVSTETLVTDEIDLYPNPFDENIIIENNSRESGGLEIKLYNSQGKLIISRLISSMDNFTNISTKGINPGMYVVIILDKGKIHTTKMIKIDK